MRALAVLLVMLYHAGVPWLPGGYSGVDVFFVISGYVITGVLATEVRRTGTVRLTRFWARRARRLLPAAALVLVTTALLSLWVMPQVRWREIGWDVVTSAFYVVNWRLADRSVDYLAEDSLASPVQHYWSLAVEEQFYLLWPLLILLAVVLARRRRWPVIPTTGVLLALLVVLPSFVWAVHLSQASPQEAYFVTTTRLWQLGLGALVALAGAWWQRVPVPVATLLAWAGPLAVLLGGLLLGPQTAWPGWAALVPSLGAVAMLVGGVRASRDAGPTWLHELPALQWTGALSYSLYLWHWPLLVLAGAAWGGLTVTQGLLVVAFSFLPAAAGHVLIEQPVRYARGLAAAPAAGIAVALVCTAGGAAAGGYLVEEVDRRIQANQADENGGAQRRGALALTDDAAVTSAPGDPGAETGSPPAPTALEESGTAVGAEVGAGRVSVPPDGTAGAPGPAIDSLDLQPASITPDPLEATRDVPQLYEDECDATGDEVVRCSYGDPDGEVVIAVVGDSKIAQWVGALDVAGQDRGWQILLYYRSACPWSAAPVPYDEEGRAEDCQDWGDEVASRLIESDRPDVVLTSSVKSRGIGPAGELSVEALSDGMAQRWSRVADAGIEVVAVADTPQPGGIQVYECVAENRDDLETCQIRFNPGSGTPALLGAVAQVPTSTFVTMNDWVCPGRDVCPPVVGDVLVYRQGSHITETYASSLSEVLADRLQAAFGELAIAGPGLDGDDTSGSTRERAEAQR